MIDAEAARLDAYLRSVPDALARSGSKLRRAVKDDALASVALQRLLETGQVIEFKYKKQRLCLHSAHLPQQPARVRHSQETSLDVDHDLSLQEVHQAYDRVRGRQLGSAVFISDLATELQIGLPKLHEWIHREVIKSGHGSLDDGHWPTATEGQRAAAIEHLGSRRLLIRFSQPDRAALIKEYDGQVETPQNRNREQDDGADNEIDGEAAIKLYNELVKSPEDRLALEKELPSLVAARDKAVTAAKREQLQKETDQIPGHAAKVRR